MITDKINRLHAIFFAEKRKRQVERLIFWVAIFTFILHFVLLLLAQQGVIPAHLYNYRVIHPISSIYTPFSVILLYEVYVIIYYLPKSITIYLGKQYEVIVLILIRKIFEELGELVPIVDNGNFSYKSIMDLAFSFIGFIILFLLVLLFYKLSGKKDGRTKSYKESKMRFFITSKKVFALLLLLFFIVLFVKSLFDMRGISLSIDGGVYMLKRINQLFFTTFFSALILIEVLLLLLTLDLTDKFSKVVRNSGFIISTILLKMSFMVEGLMNIMLILLAVSFGVAIVGGYNLYKKWMVEDESELNS